MTLRSARHALLCALGAVFLLCASQAAADSWAFVGSRYQAMGGTGVAFSNDSTSAYWNPANLAWQKGWDVQIPATVDASVENRGVQKLSNLIITAEDIEQEINDYFNCSPSCSATPASPQTQQRLMGFLTQLATFGSNGESVHADANLGLAGRYNNMAFTGYSLTTATIFPSVDLNGVGLDLAAIDFIVGNTGVPVDTGLVNEIIARPDTIIDPTNGPGGSNGWEVAQVQHLVWLAEQDGANTADPRVRTLLGNIVGYTSQGTNPFAENGTGALTAGVSSQEIGFSYAHKIPIPIFGKSRGVRGSVMRYLHNRMSVGGTLKYMLGITFLKALRYDDTNSTGDLFNEWFDLANTTYTSTVGLDLGFTWRPVDFVSLGMVARNVNSPSFDIAPFVSAETGLLVTAVDMDPQVRLGISLVPIRNLTLAFDFDATENSITTLPGFKSRIISLGAEYDIPFGKHFGLALRAGGYSNISDTVNQDWAMTGGLGLRTGLFQLDLSLGSSFADEAVRTGTYTYRRLPTRLSVGLGLKFEKSI